MEDFLGRGGMTPKEVTTYFVNMIMDFFGKAEYSHMIVRNLIESGRYMQMMDVVVSILEVFGAFCR